MQFEYEITEQDFLDGQRLAMKTYPVRSIRWSRLFLPLIGVAGLVFWIQTVARQGLSLRVTTGLFFPLLFLSFPLLTRWNERKLYRKATALHGKLRLEVGEGGWASSGPSFSGKVDWSNFSRFFEDKKCFVIYQDTRVFNIIPKRYLSADQICDLRQYFDRYIGNSKSQL